MLCPRDISVMSSWCPRAALRFSWVILPWSLLQLLSVTESVLCLNVSGDQYNYCLSSGQYVIRCRLEVELFPGGKLISIGNYGFCYRGIEGLY